MIFVKTLDLRRAVQIGGADCAGLQVDGMCRPDPVPEPVQLPEESATMPMHGDYAVMREETQAC